ncbi:hypothetical protein [Saccharopolyspora hattusasensis]|uniref:hypothetical protein n=1 Tax=Saccharopolyspora hattusasensis TaxID=1128679 RepID=UPI003D9568F0
MSSVVGQMCSTGGTVAERAEGCSSDPEVAGDDVERGDHHRVMDVAQRPLQIVFSVPGRGPVRDETPGAVRRGYGDPSGPDLQVLTGRGADLVPANRVDSTM